jgi:FecR protein
MRTAWHAGDTLGRSLALGLGLVALLAGSGWLVFERFVAAPPPAITVAPPAESGLHATVVEVVGAVERNEGEAWVALRVGDALDAEDSIRTGPGSRADLRVGNESSRLSIPERSEMRVDKVTSAVHAFRLARGRIDVDYQDEDERVLRVRSGEGAVAETRAARFTVLRNGTMVAVATRNGAVSLSSAGGSVELGAGQQTVVFDGAKPLAVQPIPLKVLLEVATKASANDSLCLSVSGRVRPGSEVLVEDIPAEVSQDGSFRADVPRREGRTQVRVVAREPGGETRSKLLACRPSARAGPSWKESVTFHWNEEH